MCTIVIGLIALYSLPSSDFCYPYSLYLFTASHFSSLSFSVFLIPEDYLNSLEEGVNTFHLSFRFLFSFMFSLPMEESFLLCFFMPSVFPLQSYPRTTLKGLRMCYFMRKNKKDREFFHVPFPVILSSSAFYYLSISFSSFFLPSSRCICRERKEGVEKDR